MDAHEHYDDVVARTQAFINKAQGTQTPTDEITIKSQPKKQQAAAPITAELVAEWVDIMQREQVTTAEVASRADAFASGFHGEFNAIEAAMLSAVSSDWFSHDFKNGLLKTMTLGGPDLGSIADVYGSVEAYDAMDYSQRNTRLQQHKAKVLEEYYDHPFLEVDRSGYQTLGQVSKFIADPTTLLPGGVAVKTATTAAKVGGIAGKTMLKGAAIGAATGGVDSVIRNAADVEGATPMEVVLGMTIGGTVGGALSGLAVKWAGKALANKGIPTIEAINADRAIQTKQLQGTLRALDDPEMLKTMPAERIAEHKAMLQGRMENLSLLSAEEVQSGISKGLKLGDDGLAYDKLVDIVRYDMRTNGPDASEILGGSSAKEVLDGLKKTQPYKKASAKQKTFIRKSLERAEAELQTAKANPDIPGKVDELSKAVTIPDVNVPKGQEKAAKAGADKAKARTAPEAAAKTAADAEQDIAKQAQAALEKSEHTVGMLGTEIKHRMLNEVTNSAIGASGGAGVTAYNGGNADEVITAAIAGGAVGWASTKLGKSLYRKIGRGELRKAAEQGDQAAVEALKHQTINDQSSFLWATRPSEYFKKHGETGKIYAAKMARADRILRTFVGEGNAHLKQTFEAAGLKMKGEDGLIVRDLLKKSGARIANATEAHHKAARETRKLLDDALKSARDLKIITPEKYTELMDHTKKFGYFPRVYDSKYLATKQGRREFERVLVGTTFKDEHTAEMAIQSLTNGPKNVVKDIMANMSHQPDGTLKFNKYVAERISKRARTAVDVKRSHHLENARKIPEELEEQLDQFMVQDFSQNMYQYMTDVGKRLAYASEFGAKEHQLNRLIIRMGKEHPESNAAAAMQENFYMSVGDPASKYIQQMMKQPELYRKAMNVGDTFANYMLALAQVLNAGQPLVNGTLRVAATEGGSGGVKSIKTFSRGLKETLFHYSPARRTEIAERAGAAFEAEGMRLLGEGQAYRTSSVRKNGVMGIMKGAMFPDTQTALKMTGFQAVERNNRSIAFNLGKAHIEDLLEQQAKLNKKIATQGPGKNFTSQLDKIRKSLVELGMDPDMDPMAQHVKSLDDAADLFSNILNKGDESIDSRAMRGISDINEGAMKFSNDVNFISTPMTKPEIWNSPYAKIFTKFKTFSMHHAHFLNDNVLRPMRQGNLGPALTYAAVAPSVGYPIATVREWIRGSEEDRTSVEAYFHSMGSSGGVGLAMDMLTGAASHREGAEDFIQGPILGTIFKGLSTLHDAGAWDALEEMDVTKLADIEGTTLTQFAAKSHGHAKAALDIYDNVLGGDVHEVLRKE